jgi:hypothetical protein
MWWEVEGRDNPASASKQLKVLSDSQPLTYLSPLPPFKLRSTHSIPPTSPVRTLPNVCHTRRRTRGFGALWVGAGNCDGGQCRYTCGDGHVKGAGVASSYQHMSEPAALDGLTDGAG